MSDRPAYRSFASHANHNNINLAESLRIALVDDSLDATVRGGSLSSARAESATRDETGETLSRARQEVVELRVSSSTTRPRRGTPPPSQPTSSQSFAAEDDDDEAVLQAAEETVTSVPVAMPRSGGARRRARTVTTTTPPSTPSQGNSFASQADAEQQGIGSSSVRVAPLRMNDRAHPQDAQSTVTTATASEMQYGLIDEQFNTTLRTARTHRSQERSTDAVAGGEEEELLLQRGTQEVVNITIGAASSSSLQQQRRRGNSRRSDLSHDNASQQQQHQQQLGKQQLEDEEDEQTVAAFEETLNAAMLAMPQVGGAGRRRGRSMKDAQQPQQQQKDGQEASASLSAIAVVSEGESSATLQMDSNSTSLLVTRKRAAERTEDQQDEEEEQTVAAFEESVNAAVVAVPQRTAGRRRGRSELASSNAKSASSSQDHHHVDPTSNNSAHVDDEEAPQSIPQWPPITIATATDEQSKEEDKDQESEIVAVEEVEIDAVTIAEPQGGAGRRRGRSGRGTTDDPPQNESASPSSHSPSPPPQQQQSITTVASAKAETDTQNQHQHQQQQKKDEAEEEEEAVVPAQEDDIHAVAIEDPKGGARRQRRGTTSTRNDEQEKTNDVSIETQNNSDVSQQQTVSGPILEVKIRCAEDLNNNNDNNARTATTFAVATEEVSQEGDNELYAAELDGPQGSGGRRQQRTESSSRSGHEDDKKDSTTSSRTLVEGRDLSNESARPPVPSAPPKPAAAAAYQVDRYDDDEDDEEEGSSRKRSYSRVSRVSFYEDYRDEDDDDDTDAGRSRQSSTLLLQQQQERNRSYSVASSSHNAPQESGILNRFLEVLSPRGPRAASQGPSAGPQALYDSTGSPREANGSYVGADGAPYSPREGGSSLNATRGEVIDLSTARRPSSMQPGSSSASNGLNGTSTNNSNPGSSPLGRTFSDVQELLSSVNIFSSGRHAHWSLTVFRALILLASVLFFGMAVFLFIEQFVEAHWIVVADNSLCQGAISKLSKTGSVTYQAVMMLVGVWFLLWFGIRAVRMEKTGLLFCFVCVVTLQAWRCMYFSYGGSLNEYYPSQGSNLLYQTSNVNQYQGHMRDPDVDANNSKRLAVQIILTTGCALCVFAVFLIPIVMRQFGWYTYAKGVTFVDQLVKLEGHMRFDTAIKLDTFVTVVTFVSVFFLLQNDGTEIGGAIVTFISLVMLLLFKEMVRRRQSWFVYVATLVGISAPIFYIYVIVLLFTQSDALCLEDINQCMNAHSVSPLAVPYDPSQGQNCEPQQWADLNLTLARQRDPPLSNYPVVCFSASDTVSYSVTGPYYASSTAQRSFYPSNSTILPQLGVCALYCGELCAANCYVPIWEAIADCCSAYGTCLVSYQLQRHDEVLMITLAMILCVVRIVTLGFGYRQRREMNLESVQGMFQRAERNIRRLKDAAIALKSGRGGGGGSPRHWDDSEDRAYDGPHPNVNASSSATSGKKRKSYSAASPAGGAAGSKTRSNHAPLYGGKSRSAIFEGDHDRITSQDLDLESRTRFADHSAFDDSSNHTASDDHAVPLLNRRSQEDHGREVLCRPSAADVDDDDSEGGGGGDGLHKNYSFVPSAEGGAAGRRRKKTGASKKQQQPQQVNHSINQEEE